MKGGYNKFRAFIERFYPDYPITISFSKVRVFILLIIIGFVCGILYLRYQNKNELQILEVKHKEIQLIISDYLKNMSQVNLDSGQLQELRGKINDIQKKLKVVEEDIKHIKKVWFLE